MFHFLQKKMLKKICNKGTINVLQGGGVSGVWSKTILLHFFFTLTRVFEMVVCGSRRQGISYQEEPN